MRGVGKVISLHICDNLRSGVLLPAKKKIGTLDRRLDLRGRCIKRDKTSAKGIRKQAAVQGIKFTFRNSRARETGIV